MQKLTVFLKIVSMVGISGALLAFGLFAGGKWPPWQTRNTGPMFPIGEAAEAGQAASHGSDGRLTAGSAADISAPDVSSLVALPPDFRPSSRLLEGEFPAQDAQTCSVVVYEGQTRPAELLVFLLENMPARGWKPISAGEQDNSADGTLESLSFVRDGLLCIVTAEKAPEDDRTLATVLLLRYTDK